METKAQWDGEDQEGNVKDSWDQDSDEEEIEMKEKGDKQPQQESTASTKKSLKKICKRFEEKERQREAEAKEIRERLLAEMSHLPSSARRKKMMREGPADLSIAKEVYGISDKKNTSSSAVVRPST